MNCFEDSVFKYVWRRGEVHKRVCWGKRPLGRPGPRCEDNVKIDLQEVGWGHGVV
jgi:hypothetical protein